MRAPAAALVAAASLLLAHAAHAQGAGGWYTQVDNDVFFHTDRWYTSGVRIARVVPRGDRKLEMGLLQEIYTPEAKLHDPVDRPTAARLLATLASHDRREGEWTTVELDLGVTGPAALGRQAQELVHRVVPAPHEDWSHQRSNRLDAQFAWVRSHDFQGDPAKLAHLYAHYGVVAGNQLAFAHGGLELRFGHGAALALATPALRFAATPPLAGGDGSWSAFVGTSVRAVGVNHLLDFPPGLESPPARRKPTVGRFLGGVAW
ncbi:MAG TPA: lipid A-modifier LpxR family protein, partial [Usitatibacter sp.]|nr:lipid A-modifier LpxR family protein [Usitatibacter sp.]